MRLSGKLQTWHDDRGFGFITPMNGGPEIFAHISAFPQDGSRPTQGEQLSYELGRARDGRPQAVNIIRTAMTGARRARDKAPVQDRSWLGRIVLLLILCVVGKLGFDAYQARAQRAQLAALPAHGQAVEVAPGAGKDAPSFGRTGSQATSSASASKPSRGFQCDGRKLCSQMTSCEEATWFINHCPGTEMDGNHDGVPCERQWCKP